MKELSEELKLVEVTPRDGLQNEKRYFSTDEKINLINSLEKVGFKNIEVSSFVSPDTIPQLKDADEVVSRLQKKNQDTVYSALVPNDIGAKRAIEAGADQIAVFLSATETHNKSNVRMSRSQSLNKINKVCQLASEKGLPVRGYIGVAFQCPLENKVPKAEIIKICNEFKEMGIKEISLGDTTGTANPYQVKDMIHYFKERIDNVNLALHFHDTKGMAMVNVFSAYQEGVRIFDGSLGGLGGCPNVLTGGNVVMEEMVNMFESMGIRTGISLDNLLALAISVEEKVKRLLPGKLLKSI